MPKLRLTGRKAALVGLSAAAATAAVVAVAAPAVAAPSQLTTCSDTVRVRSQPNANAPVIGSCQSGERVTVDETRNGYAHLVNKKGWASLTYVSLRNADSSSSYDENDRYDNGRNDNDRYDNGRYDNGRYDNGRYDNDYDDDDNGLLGGLGGN